MALAHNVRAADADGLTLNVLPPADLDHPSVRAQIEGAGPPRVLAVVVRGPRRFQGFDIDNEKTPREVAVFVREPGLAFPLHAFLQGWKHDHPGGQVTLRAPDASPFWDVEQVIASCTMAGLADVRLGSPTREPRAFQFPVIEVQSPGSSPDAPGDAPARTIDLALSRDGVVVAGLEGGKPETLKGGKEALRERLKQLRSRAEGQAGRVVLNMRDGERPYGEALDALEAAGDAGFKQIVLNNLIGSPLVPSKPADPSVRVVRIQAGTGGVDANAPDRGDAHGALAPFGVPGGDSAVGPRVGFIGMRGIARSVIYVCDSSGSMINKFDPLRVELRKAVSALKATQSFNVVFFQEQEPKALGKELLPADAANKRKADDFLVNIAPRGSTDPIPAIKMAFAMKPRVIYLLTDGDFPDNDAVLKTIATLNADKAVKVHTIAFMDHDEGYEKLLQKIAADNGGQYKFVAEDDLGN